MSKGFLKCRGHVLGIDAKTGKTVFENHNMFVQLGLNELAKIVGGQTGTVPTHIAVGTSNVAPNIGDTSLKGSELGRKAFDSVDVSDSTISFMASFGAGEATGVWEETGMFTAASGGIMWSRALTGTYTKKDKDEIKVFWNYTFEDNSAE